MRPVAIGVAWSVGVCVSLSVCWAVDTTMRPAKTAEPIEMPFGLWTVVGQSNNVFGRGRVPRGKGKNFFRGTYPPDCKV